MTSAGQDGCETRLVALRLLGSQLLTVMEQTEGEGGRALIPYAFLRKSMRLLDAIDTLISGGLAEEAQVRVRALIETRINLEYFLILANQDHAKAFARVID